ncbi:zinc-binding alcohol dehydrogenase-like protein [Penicillium atrosanguineum]|nr:zinc-binding alcohol dehydrogenase-like protein [Penicillium atrosanguineum]
MPSNTRAWILKEQNGIDSLEIIDQALPEIGDFDVLVKLHAASLNYRDIVLATGSVPLPFFRPGVVPASDGAGIVETVGSKVQAFRPGDRVCTHLTSEMPASKTPSMADICSGLGQHVDGTLRSHGVFHETALVSMPEGLDFLQASTLTCSGLTAWNALFGINEYRPRKGAYVLIQGSGGCLDSSLAGATVIATTSSSAKATRLKSLGAHHVLNYRDDSNWGETAKNLTHGKGIDLVVDVGGLSTLPQSFKAVRTNGLIALTGMLGKADGELPSLMDCLMNVCTVRGVLLGTRDQFDEMNRFTEEKGIRPVVDERVFGFEECKEAYRLLERQGHFSKVCVSLQ